MFPQATGAYGITQNQLDFSQRNLFDNKDLKIFCLTFVKECFCGGDRVLKGVNHERKRIGTHEKGDKTYFNSNWNQMRFDGL